MLLYNERAQAIQAFQSQVDAVHDQLRRVEDALGKQLLNARNGLTQVSNTINQSVTQAKNVAGQLDPGKYIKTGIKVKPITEWKAPKW